MARIVYYLVRFGLTYVKKQEAAYAQQVRERLEMQLRRRAKELGFTLIEPPSPEANATATEPRTQ